jgi:hypothetical protein
MKIVGYYPLWVVIANWFLQCRAIRREANFPAREGFLLLFLRRELPIPQGRVETKVAAWIHEWIDRQQNRRIERMKSGLSVLDELIMIDQMERRPVRTPWDADDSPAVHAFIRMIQGG